MKRSALARFAACATENEFDIALISIKGEVCEGCDTVNRRYHGVATKLLICWWRRRYADCGIGINNLVLIQNKNLRTVSAKYNNEVTYQNREIHSFEVKSHRTRRTNEQIASNKEDKRAAPVLALNSDSSIAMIQRLCRQAHLCRKWLSSRVVCEKPANLDCGRPWLRCDESDHH